MPPLPRLTERDKQLLDDLYNLGGMNVKQIWKTSFCDTTLNYTKRRLHMLKQRGYVTTEGHVYRATQQGLIRADIEIKARPDKILTKQNRAHIIKLSEIFAGLYKTPWKWLNSRTVKEKFVLDRLCKLDGMLYNTRTKSYYLVYLLNENPYEDTILRIRSEISRLGKENGLYKAIIFAQSAKGMKLFGEKNIPIGELHMLPYPFGINIIRAMQPNWIQKLLETYWNANRFMLTSTKALHADYIIELDGTEYYLVELLTNDLVKKYHLSNYGQDQALRDRKVKVICFDSQYNKFQEQLNYPHHIEFITIQEEWFLNNL